MNPGTRNATVKNTVSKEVKVIDEALSTRLYRQVDGSLTAPLPSAFSPKATFAMTRWTLIGIQVKL